MASCYPGCWQRLYAVRLVRTAHATRAICCQSNNSDILVTALHEPLQPNCLRVGSPRDKSHHCSSTLDQHGSQVDGAMIRDTTERGLPAARSLPRRQSRPCRKMPAVLELPRIADCAHNAVATKGPIPGIEVSNLLSSR